MEKLKGKPRRDATPIVVPMKRVAIGADLERLQAELAELRRRAEIYPRTQPVVKTITRPDSD